MHPRITITVFVVGFVLRLVPLALPFEFRGPDSVGYLAPAASLVAGAGYADEHGEPTAARPPGYPLFLAGIYAVAGGPTDVGARVAQAALGALAALCVMGLLASRPTTRPVALAGGLLVACDPIAVGQSPFLLREVLLLALLAALLLALARLRGRRRFAAAALLLAALALTHQLYALLGGFLAAVDLLAARKSRRLSRLAPWFAVGLVVLLAIVLWARRNERVVGHFSVTATANAVPARELWLTTACSNTWLSGDLATGFQHLAFAEERRLVDTLGLDGAKSELYRRAAANWTEHPLRSLARLARQNLWYWIEVPGAVRLAAHPRLHVARWFLLAFHWARLAAAAAGLLFLLRVGWRHHRYLLATLAFFALAPALLYPVPRYLGPAAPLLDVLAVLGVGASRGVVRTP